MRVIEPWFGEDEISAVGEALRKGKLSQGEYVDRFEEELAKYLAVAAEDVVAVSSGTAALHLAMLLERHFPTYPYLSVPATTFVSCGSMIKLAGLTPLIEDVDPLTWNSLSTLGVDLFGNPLSYKPLIEDAAESLGSNYRGKKCGTLGHISCLSFFENKVITTGGEGGALVCESRDDADLARLLRQQGKDYTMTIHKHMGFNYRMTEIQAAFGIAQIPKIDQIVARKREIFNLFEETCPDLAFQEETQGGYSNRWLTCALVPDGKRDRLVEAFNKEGIPWRSIFAPLYYHSWFDKPSEPLPMAEKLWKDGIALPSSPQLSDEHVLKVCKVINDVLGV